MYWCPVTKKVCQQRGRYFGQDDIFKPQFFRQLTFIKGSLQIYLGLRTQLAVNLCIDIGTVTSCTYYLNSIDLDMIHRWQSICYRPI